MNDPSSEFQTLKITKKQKSGKFKWVFWVELIAIFFIPFMVCNSLTPMYILDSPNLHSGFLGQLTDGLARLGYILFYTLGLPISILGIIMSGKMSRLRIATRVLSILNLIISIVEVILVLLLFGYVLSELIHI